MDHTAEIVDVAALEQKLEEKERRIQDLLESNGDYFERARSAKRLAAEMESERLGFRARIHELTMSLHRAIDALEGTAEVLREVDAIAGQHPRLDAALKRLRASPTLERPSGS